jgi:hypothetical protein
VRAFALLTTALVLASCGRVSGELREPLPLQELPRLERELGVAIVGFQHEHPGTATTLTVGGGREPGEGWPKAIERHRAANAHWARMRLSMWAERAGSDAAAQRALEDRRAQIRHLEEHGALIRRIYFESWLALLVASRHPALR